MVKLLQLFILSLLLLVAPNAYATTTWLDTRIDITPGSDDTWTNVTTATTSIPDGMTVAIVTCVNTSGSAEKSCGVRKEGSTDAFLYEPENGDIQMVMVGLDSSEAFEAFKDDFTVELYLIGYTDDATFATNMSSDVAPASPTGSWEDIDISANIDEANSSGAYVIVETQANTRTWGVRADGSTDTFTVDIEPSTPAAQIVKTNSSGIFDALLEDGQPVIYVLGEFASSGWSFNTNADSNTLSTDSTYEDIDVSADATDATGVIVDTQLESKTITYGLRKNGNSTTYEGTTGVKSLLGSGVDGSEIVEGLVETVSGNPIYIIGYSYTAPVGGSRRVITVH